MLKQSSSLIQTYHQLHLITKFPDLKYLTTSYLKKLNKSTNSANYRAFHFTLFILILIKIYSTTLKYKVQEILLIKVYSTTLMHKKMKKCKCTQLSLSKQKILILIHYSKRHKYSNSLSQRC